MKVGRKFWLVVTGSFLAVLMASMPAAAQQAAQAEYPCDHG